MNLCLALLLLILPIYCLHLYWHELSDICINTSVTLIVAWTRGPLPVAYVLALFLTVAEGIRRNAPSSDACDKQWLRDLTV